LADRAAVAAVTGVVVPEKDRKVAVREIVGQAADPAAISAIARTAALVDQQAGIRQAVAGRMVAQTARRADLVLLVALVRRSR
jgi:hypothetical protein